MIGDKRLFVNFESKEGGDVTFGDNAKRKIKAFGSICNNHTSIHNVLFVDGLKHNLLSISQLCDKDCRVVFEKDSCKVININNNQIKSVGYKHGNVYVVYINDLQNVKCLVSINEDSWLWHRRLGHVGMSTISKLLKHELVMTRISIKDINYGKMIAIV
ncbi:gag_pre-integrs domain-containing protein [Cephalotus follicularis]|uniref:Gag_pre-integrs domain-containing protein n=1 Tax=Cephalotus follicularis TaxID=3775 RepID=A0A1Q3BM60_CEPFO|nr:gag_pre-integrs domain-containing protein [Cephalotus follicularis]